MMAMIYHEKLETQEDQIIIFLYIAYLLNYLLNCLKLNI